ncbi:MAG TPA: hypothetical protein DHV02_04885 [Neisseriales bacterium]|nr:hypothetical protein [Neisseriales bacterium]
MINWNYLIKLIIRHRMVEQVYKALTTTTNTLPPNFIAQLKQCSLSSNIASLSMVAESIRIARAFNKVGIEYSIVKGIPLSELLYGGATKRQAKDIDMLVSIDNLNQAIQILLDKGYKVERPNFNLTGFKRDYYFTHSHDIGLFHPERKVEIELHFRLEYFGTKFFASSANIYKTIMVQNQMLVTLNDEYHVLYLMFHASIHAWTRLRWLHDIYLYLKSGQCSLQKIYDLAINLKAKKIVWQTLWLLRDIYAYRSEYGNQILAQPNQAGLRLAIAARKFILNDYELTAGHGVFNKMFFYYRIYLMDLALPGQKLEALTGDLFKIDKIFPYLTLPRSFSWGYYLIYPFWVIKYFFTRKL